MSCSVADDPASISSRHASPAGIAAARRRTLSFGIRLHVIVRKTAEAAWMAASDFYVTTPQRSAELVFPKLSLRSTTGRDLGASRDAEPFGEMIANVAAPERAAG